MGSGEHSVRLTIYVLIFLFILVWVNYNLWKSFATIGVDRFKSRLRRFLFDESLWAGTGLVFAPAAVLALYYTIKFHGIWWTFEFILMLALLVVLVWAIARIIWLIIIAVPWITVWVILAGSILLLKWLWWPVYTS